MPNDPHIRIEIVTSTLTIPASALGRAKMTQEERRREWGERRHKMEQRVADLKKRWMLARDAATGPLRAVIDLHHPEGTVYAECAECSADTEDDSHSVDWPCRTFEAATGEAVS